jgi:methanogenic corrinoid protein MtbC1
MAKGYPIGDIKQKLLEILSQTKIGMSGVELSNKLGISRVTITKYLSVFAAEGLIRQQNMGNTTLWYIEGGGSSSIDKEGSELTQFEFPNDYFKIKTKFLDYLLDGKENKVYSLIRNCIHSNASIPKLITEVILDAILHIQKLYDDAKIGNSELGMLNNIISNSIKLAELIPNDIEDERNIILISSDHMSTLLSQCAAAAYRSEHWKVHDLGDMSESINVMFDLDLQKFLNKIWKQKSGIMIIIVFSQTSEGLNFFADIVNSIKSKMGKNLFLILYGDVDKKTTKINADLFSNDIDQILQWSQTIFESYKN